MEMDPQVAQVLALAGRFQSALDGTLNQMNTGTFRGTDDTETVEVMINGHQWLTGVRIADGLLKEVGSEVVGARINQALKNAQAAASKYNDVAGQQLTEMLASMSQTMNNGMV
ncbi:YbaB/EbfC family nucleoid-associated protein [Mycobacterium marinum]|uniref:YbaB/EbfC family nucleoid-associated protein n=1 Tax=Mycobacterium marinum TaxID=1781 RepID=UPI0035630D06